MRLDKIKIVDKKGNKFNVKVDFDYRVVDEFSIDFSKLEVVIFDDNDKEINRYSEKNYKTIGDKYEKFEECD